MCNFVATSWGREDVQIWPANICIFMADLISISYLQLQIESKGDMLSRFWLHKVAKLLWQSLLLQQNLWKNQWNKVYFAVAKKGEPPLDGKTDTDPEGLSAVNAGGKWAREVHWRLTSSDLFVSS